ncbi:FAD binding domain-containing protein, partial [bacterium]|nr:FAD binding domain-containing protein [bacterium]
PEHLPRCKGCDPRTGTAPRKVNKPPSYLIALSRIPEMSGIAVSEPGEISIGAMTTITDLCQSRIIREKLTALAQGADNLGSPLVRNRGTIGGNICNARPAADTFIPAVALGAKLELRSQRGLRLIPAQDFAVGPGKTVREEDEILTKIIFPVSADRTGSSCIKLANRKALEIAVVSAASLLTLDIKGKISSARIALGAVAPTPILTPKAAAFLSGKDPSDANFLKAGEIAVSECHPISDHRGSLDYRREMVSVLVSRSLAAAFASIIV